MWFSFKWPWLCRGLKTVRRPPAQLALEALEDRLVLSSGSLTSLTYEQWRQEQFVLDDAVFADPQEVLTGQDLQSQAMQGSDLLGLDRVFASFPYRGDNYTVAVIDSGIDYRHPALGGGWGQRVIGGWDFANNDADPMDDHGHGTHVAGIIGSSDGYYTGIAPNANFVALKVLGANGSGSFAAVEDALRWVIDHRAQYNIVAVNLSLGVGNFSYDPYGFLDDEFATIKSQGVFIAAAAGNSFFSYQSQQGLGYPAISPYAVAVGAVWTADHGSVRWGNGAQDFTTAADRLVSFSQRSNALDILAPGTRITSTYLNGGWATMSGTSMATPMAAGAAAIIYQALQVTGYAQLANQDHILSLMQNYGATVVDGDDEDDNVINTGLAFKRLDLFAALDSLQPGQPNRPPVLDPIADQTLSKSQGSLTVTLSGQDPDGDALTFQAQVRSLPSQAYQFDQQLGLNYAGSYFTNYWGLNEKWMLGNGDQWYCLRANGELRRWGGSASATLQAENLVAVLDPAYYADPSLLWNAQPSLVPAVALTFQGQQLIVTPPNGFVGQFYVDVSISDGLAVSSRTFTVTVVNNAPTLTAIADLTVATGASQAQVDLAYADFDGDALIFQAQVRAIPSQAYQLDQELGLNYAGSYYLNAWGLNEKWMLGNGGQWYCIRANGELRRWAGSASATLQAANLIAVLDASYYADPGLLWNALPPVAPNATLAFVGNQLQVTLPTGYLGSFYVDVTVSDGLAISNRTFTVTVVNNAPTLAPIADQTMIAGVGQLSINLQASDADNDTLVFQAQVRAIPSQAYQLDQELGLSYAGSYYANYWGLNEKWMLGNGDQWYCLRTNGELRRWGGSASATLQAENLVAVLDSTYFADPILLWNAQPPVAPNAALAFVGNELVVAVPTGYLGSFYVDVTASDGLATANRTFTVTVINHAPTLEAIADQTMVSGAGQLAIDILAADVDGDPLTFQAQVRAIPSQAYQLDQELGLYFAGSYYANYWGLNEKWMLGNGGQWYCIRANGELRRWAGSASATMQAANLIAALDASYYADPGLLWNAQPPLPPDVAMVISGSRLLLRRLNGYLGTLQVTITVSDGLATSSRSFTVILG